MKFRAFSSQSEYDVFFSKVFSVFEFWTFLKMSIFHSALDFLKNSSQQYILFLKILKDSLSSFLINILIHRHQILLTPLHKLQINHFFYIDQ